MSDLLPPSPPLRPFVEGYWQRRGAFAQEKKVRVLADACTKIIFELAPMPWPSSYVVGTQLSPIVVSLSGEVDRIGIRFRPGMAGFFLDRSLDGLAGRFNSFEHLQIAGGEELRKSLLDASSFAGRKAILEEWLLTRIPRDMDAVGETGRLSRTLAEGLAPPAAAEAMGWSERQLQRVCRKRFGASAASLHRLYRFELLQARLAQGRADLADLAAKLGFSDQAHMAREFRHFAGTSISSYLRERARVGNLQDAPAWLPVLRDLEAKEPA
jgi:AraC-like DNA-binding protein